MAARAHADASSTPSVNRLRMSRSALFSTLLVLLAVVFLAGCQAFLEDYSYSPLGASSSGAP